MKDCLQRIIGCASGQKCILAFYFLADIMECTVFLQIIFCLIANYNFCQDIKSNRIKKLNSGPYRNHPLRSSSFLSPPHILSKKSSKSSDLMMKCQTRTSSFPSISLIPSNPQRTAKNLSFSAYPKRKPCCLFALFKAFSQQNLFLSFFSLNPLQSHKSTKIPLISVDRYRISTQNPLPFFLLPVSLPKL